MSWAGKAPKDLTRRVVEPLSIVFAVDVSGSMRGKPIKKARAAFEEFVQKLDMQTTSIALLAFADRNKTIQSFCSSTKELNVAGRKFELETSFFSNTCGFGNEAIPFDEAFDMLKERAGKRFIVVLTDGVWNSRRKAIVQAEKIKESEVEIIAVGFGCADKAFLKKIASSDENALFSDLSRLVEDFSTIAQTIRTSTELML